MSKKQEFESLTCSVYINFLHNSLLCRKHLWSYIQTEMIKQQTYF